MLTDMEDEGIDQLLEKTGPILSLDIGSGTQDAILALPGQHPENWPKFVLPSPALVVADRIRKHTREQRSVWLYGQNMGGGFLEALKEQIAEGLFPKASPEAAAAIHDDPEHVHALGIEIVSEQPSGYASLYLTDYDPAFWESLLASTGLPSPTLVVAAVQDHGVHPEGNRIGRFLLWKHLLEKTGGAPAQWIYDVPPAACTRLKALQQETGGPVADTGTAAVLGGLATPEVISRSRRQGVTIVNVGNSHVTAFLVYRGNILGIYEHHTGLLDTDSLCFDLREFRFGWLPDEQVRAKGGHGCAFLAPLPPEAEGFG